MNRKTRKPRGIRVRYQPDPYVAGLGMRVPEIGEPEWAIDVVFDDRHIHRAIGRVGSEISKRTAGNLASEMVAVNAGTHPTLPTLEMVASQYLSAGKPRWAKTTYYANCIAVRKFGKLLDLPINQVDRAVVSAWHRSTGSNRHLAILSGTMKYADQQKLIPPGNNPCRGLRQKQRRFRANCLNEADYRRLQPAFRASFQHQPAHTAALMLLALTGARLGEILQSCWYQVVDEGLHLPTSKSGARFVTLCTTARRLLSILPKGQPQDRIFRQRDGSPLSTGALDRRWRAIKRAACLASRFRIHDLRHGFAAAGLNHGEELTVIGELLGHKDHGTTRYYAHLSSSSVRHSSNKVARRIARQLDGECKKDKDADD